MTESHETSSPYPVILDDKPAKEDSLGGSVEKIAQAIVALIQCCETGKRIGLFGNRGTGKSTVVKRISENLSSENSHVFVFDAWAHEGDTLRLTFFKSLTAELTVKGYLNRESWEIELDKLAGTRTDIQMQKSEGLTFSILFVWIISIVIAKIDPVKSSELPDILTNMLPYAFSFMPVVILLGLLNYEGKGSVSKFLGLNQRLYSSTTQNRSADSYEFELSFKKMLQQCGERKLRFLIVCIDNLDRLEQDAAKSVWSTMQSFIDVVESIDQTNLKIWTIVPLQYEYTSLLWDSCSPYVDIPCEKIANPAEQSISRSQSPEKESFLEKTFQIKFTLPPPVHFSFNEFFLGKAKEAFGEELYIQNLNDFKMISFLYQKTFLEDLNARKAILYLNELVTSYKMWEKKIPLLTQAGYGIISKFEQDIPKFVEAEESKYGYLTGCLECSWKEGFLSIYYNQEYADIKHVLLRDQLEHAIIGGDIKAIQSLMKTNHYAHLLESLFHEMKSIYNNNLQQISHFIEVLEVSQTETEICEADTLWKYLWEALKDTNNWSHLDHQTSKGITTLISRFYWRNPYDSIRPIRKIIKSISRESRIQESEKIIWLSGYLDILEFVKGIPELWKDLSVEFLAPKGISLLYIAGNYRSLQEEQQCLLKDMKPEFDIQEYLIERCKTKTLDHGDLRILDFNNEFWQPIASPEQLHAVACQTLQNKEVNFDTAYALLTLGFKTRNSKTERSHLNLEVLAKNGTLSYYYENYKGRGFAGNSFFVASFYYNSCGSIETEDSLLKNSWGKTYFSMMQNFYKDSFRESMQHMSAYAKDLGILEDMLTSSRYVGYSEFVFVLACLSADNRIIDANCIIESLDLESWGGEIFRTVWDSLPKIKNTLTELRACTTAVTKEVSPTIVLELKNLKLLDLRATGLSNKTIGSIRKALPNCMVFYDMEKNEDQGKH